MTSILYSQNKTINLLLQISLPSSHSGIHLPHHLIHSHPQRKINLSFDTFITVFKGILFVFQSRAYRFPGARWTKFCARWNVIYKALALARTRPRNFMFSLCVRELRGLYNYISMPLDKLSPLCPRAPSDLPISLVFYYLRPFRRRDAGNMGSRAGEMRFFSASSVYARQPFYFGCTHISCRRCCACSRGWLRGCLDLDWNKLWVWLI